MSYTYLSQVSLGALRAVLSVADAGSFRRAAESLHVAQPSVSRKIAQLEDRLGCRLFERNSASVTLTRAGQLLVARLPALLAELDQTLGDAGKAALGLAGAIRVGFSEAAMSSFLPPLLRQVKRECAGCEIELIEATSNEIAAGVAENRMDVGFSLSAPDDPRLDRVALPSEAVGVVLPDDHPLATAASLSLSDLRDERFILFPRHVNARLYDRMIECCMASGFSPRIDHQVTPRSRAIAMVAAGEGIATISARLQHQCVPGTVYRPLAPPAPSIEFTMLLRSGTDTHWSRVMRNCAGRLEPQPAGAIEAG